MYRAIARRLACVLLTGACLSLGAPAAAAPETDANWTFDFSQGPTFMGFGVHMWLGQRQTAKADALLRELNARLVRISLIPKITLDQLRPGQSVEQLLATIDANDTPAQRDLIKGFSDRMRQMGISLHLIFWRMPEPWVTTRPASVGSKVQQHFAQPEHLQDYANLVTAQLLYLKRLGVAPMAVELTNEPHGAWGTFYERGDYASLVAMARKTLDRQGLQSVPIAGPGTSLKAFDHYIGALQERGFAAQLAQATLHVYDSPDQILDPRWPGVASFGGRGHFGPVVISEFGTMLPEDAGLPKSGLNAASPEFALSSAASAVALLDQGARGLIYWQLQDPPWEGRQHGLLSPDADRHPVADALKVLFSQLPLGARQAAPTGRLPPELYAVALQNDEATWLLVVNTGEKPRDFKADFRRGSGACRRFTRSEVWNSQARPAESVLTLNSSDSCTATATLGGHTVAALRWQ